MRSYKRLKSILIKDGKKYAVNLAEWGKFSLQGQELEQFENDLEEIAKYCTQQIVNGNLIVEPIIEKLNSDGTFNIIVGDQFSFKEEYVPPVKESEWHQRMSQDPNIITYNSQELLSEN